MGGDGPGQVVAKGRLGSLWDFPPWMFMMRQQQTNVCRRPPPPLWWRRQKAGWHQITSISAFIGVVVSMWLARLWFKSQLGLSRVQIACFPCAFLQDLLLLQTCICCPLVYFWYWKSKVVEIFSCVLTLLIISCFSSRLQCFSAVLPSSPSFSTVTSVSWVFGCAQLWPLLQGSLCSYCWTWAGTPAHSPQFTKV